MSKPPLHYLVLVAPWAVLLAIAVVGLLTEPDPRGFGTHEQFGFGPCGFREWLGAPCPTCGVTTAVSHLAHGHPARSWETQPLGAILAMAAAVAAPWSLIAHLRSADLAAFASRHGMSFWSGAVIVVATCWFLATR
ncbi:hypothetical protein Poly30_47050 [Planctomycetes bacterium Poly30]|uniref:DUF2752 domain-containing protein n=1 Tax=Saltatorellus ferox TaxID=2528018 RepID=A0A518EYI1_9BACT|nr:hypothetical protein Poly30_47050 [Planctomycetes bacterium Poly30]